MRTVTGHSVPLIEVYDVAYFCEQEPRTSHEVAEYLGRAVRRGGTPGAIRQRLYRIKRALRAYGIPFEPIRGEGAWDPTTYSVTRDELARIPE